MDTDMMELVCVRPGGGRARNLKDPQGLAKQNLAEMRFSPISGRDAGRSGFGGN
jgi:hypothetical protein